MNCSKIQKEVYMSPRLKVLDRNSLALNTLRTAHNNVSQDSVSFQGAGNTLAKKSMFAFRNLSEYMNNISEITNALIAAIGTGIIAPAIILVSPGKGDKEDKEKKFFQAIRQPLSAGLALLFQLPMTMLITRGIDSLAYKHKLNIFKDDVIGDLFPDNKYLQKRITPEEFSEMEAKFDDTSNGKSLRQELEEKIRKEYKNGELELSDEKLQKEVKKKKARFIREKIANNKRKELIKTRAEEMLRNNFDTDKIKDTDLVNEDLRNQVKLQLKPQYDAIANDPKYKLSWFDKTIKMMGFSNKKTKALEDAQKVFTQTEGFKILEQENQEMLRDAKQKLIKYLENKDKSAQKLFSGKKFWISLFVNLFMVSASCYALNWAHPRLKEQIDKFNHKDKVVPNTQQQKVEVK